MPGLVPGIHVLLDFWGRGRLSLHDGERALIPGMNPNWDNRYETPI
jgi:hypothetical protein